MLGSNTVVFASSTPLPILFVFHEFAANWLKRTIEIRNGGKAYDV